MINNIIGMYLICAGLTGLIWLWHLLKIQNYNLTLSEASKLTKAIILWPITLIAMLLFYIGDKPK